MSQPFKRSLALRAALNEASTRLPRGFLLDQAIRAISSRREFQPRGHGRGKRSGVNVKALAKMRNHFNSNQYAMAAYVPYGGAKEIARRAAAWPQ